MLPKDWAREAAPRPAVARGGLFYGSSVGRARRGDRDIVRGDFMEERQVEQRSQWEGTS